jgi:hypothetical protein
MAESATSQDQLSEEYKLLKYEIEDMEAVTCSFFVFLNFY